MSYVELIDGRAARRVFIKSVLIPIHSWGTVPTLQENTSFNVSFINSEVLLFIGKLCVISTNLTCVINSSNNFRIMPLAINYNVIKSTDIVESPN